MRIDLPDGQWAELRDSITHGEDKQLTRAKVRSRSDEDEAGEFITALVRVFVRAWNVRDPDGNAIPLTADDAIDRAPFEVIVALAREANAAYARAITSVPTLGPSDD